MDPSTAGLLTFGANAGSTLYNNQQNQANVQSQEDFQERMSDSAYTRSVADMKNAGLNPMMMFGSGGPATTPMGSAANSQSMGTAVSAGMDTAIAMRGQNKDIQAQDKAMDLQDSQIGNTDADTENKSATADLIRNQVNSTAMDIKQKAYANKILGDTVDSQIKKANAEGNYAEINQMMGVINSGASTATQLLNPITNQLRNLTLPKGK